MNVIAMAFDGGELSPKEIEQIVQAYNSGDPYYDIHEAHQSRAKPKDKSVANRRPPSNYREPQARDIALAAGLGTLSAEEARRFSHTQAGKAIMQEYEDIRRDPGRSARQFDEMERTYQNYVNRTGNPVEQFIPMKNMYAALTKADGTDVVIYDPTAPHAAIMAHELGHIDMNHSSDPLALLQRTGLGRWSGDNAIALGGIGALTGGAFGQALSRLNGGTRHLRNQGIGSLIGGAVGTTAASGQTMYELGASGRAMHYLPEDVNKADAAGDLIRAGSTYFMGGPGEAAVTAAGVGGAALLAAHPRTRDYARDSFNYITRKAGDIFGNALNAPAGANTTTRHNPTMPAASSVYGY